MSDPKKNTPTRVPTPDGWRRIEGGRINESTSTPGRRIEKGTTINQQQPHTNPPPPPRKDKK
jgi:hypothetical protein